MLTPENIWLVEAKLSTFGAIIWALNKCTPITSVCSLPLIVDWNPLTVRRQVQLLAQHLSLLESS